MLWDTRDGAAYKALLSLTDDAVLAWEPQPGKQPNATVDEFHDCDEALRKHPDVIAALAARGITDMSLVLIDMWTYGGHLIPERYRGPPHRLVRRVAARRRRPPTRTRTRSAG